MRRPGLVKPTRVVGRDPRSVLREALDHIGTHGLGPESLVMIGHGVFRRLDSIQKRRLLLDNQRRLAQRAGGVASA